MWLDLPAQLKFNRASLSSEKWLEMMGPRDRSRWSFAA
jgi:hypothetical protein